MCGSPHVDARGRRRCLRLDIILVPYPRIPTLELALLMLTLEELPGCCGDMAK